MAPEDRPQDDDEHGECRHEIEQLQKSQLKWLPGMQQSRQPYMECGDEFLVAVRVVSDNKTREWWELQVIKATETGFEVDGNGWGWDWTNVEFYVPLKDIEKTIPPFVEHAGD